MNIFRIPGLLAATAMLFLTGCFLEERMFWSPDGRRAAVCTPEGLCLVDTNGNLSAPLVADVSFASWLPDGQGLVVLRRLAATNWPQISHLISGEERAMVEGLAAGLPGLIAGALQATGGDVSALEERFLKPLKLDPGPAFLVALMCLRDTQPEVFSNLVASGKGAEPLDKDLAEAGEAIVQEISVIRLDGDRLASEPLILERTLAELSEPRPSPAGRLLAFLRDAVLTIVPLDGGTNRLAISDRVAGSFDWTPDGKALVFASGASEHWESGGINLAHVQRRVVVGPDGQAAEGENLLLAVGAFPFLPRVRCLPDGRVLFASQPVQLPLGSSSTNETRFFLVNPATNAGPVALAVPPGTLPVDLAAFAVSPDGRRIAIGEYGSDAVAVLEIATGRLDVISPNRGARNRTMPAWRGSDELYFAALPREGAKRPEWFRWKTGITPVVFSGGWPDGVMQNLLELP